MNCANMVGMFDDIYGIKHLFSFSIFVFATTANNTGSSRFTFASLQDA